MVAVDRGDARPPAEAQPNRPPAEPGPHPAPAPPAALGAAAAPAPHAAQLGAPRSAAGPQPVNEIAKHVYSRYISAPQACWRIFSYHMHQHRPAIYRLPVHLEGQHNVYFAPGASAAQVR
jgi:hypothetical protein